MRAQSMSLATIINEHPIISIALFWSAWKALLLLLAFSSPGIGYDTSTSLQHLAFEKSETGVVSGSAARQRLLQHLVRWDALYFRATARRGYLYEQEWAFGWGWTQTMRYACKVLCVDASSSDCPAWAGITIAHVGHLLSALVLHRLFILVHPAPAGKRHALIAATLHTVAPAGLFLSSPYSESCFSFLNFLGCCCYVFGSKRRVLSGDTSILLSGLLFGTATTFRTNGVFNGLLFAADLCSLGPLGVWQDLRYAIALVLGGMLNGFGFVLPQLIAYQHLCGAESASVRPWCSSLVPSVYTFVQRHYWNVGLLRYWTLSNLPLFMLALPMLAFMLYSALIPLVQVLKPSLPRRGEKQTASLQEEAFATKMWARLALPQVLLTVLAFTSFHVQTITRIASGYVLPYALLAHIAIDGIWMHQSSRLVKPKWIVRWMVMYAVIQGGLYTSFLPPA